MDMRKLVVFSEIALSCFCSMVEAESDWQYCDITIDSEFLPPVENPEESKVDVKADNAQLIESGTSVFSGNVIVERGGQELKADRATYNQISGDVTAKGNIQVRDSEIILNADQAEWSLSNDKGSLIDAEYQLRESHANGEAAYVHREGKQRTYLEDATYTTCAPGDDAWLLEASKVNLDHDEAVGTARDVVIRLGGWPVFYTPYINFPLNDERKSGFLLPTFGNSDQTGVDIITPYYWNIAPDKDATFSPRYMSDRGLMLIGEYRYLTERSQGEVGAGFLSSDSMKKNGSNINQNYKEDRKHFTLQNTTKFSSRWSSDIDYNYVSDKAYLEDFGNNLTLTSTSFLNRKLDVDYYGDNWDFVGRVQGYQTLVDTDKPYQRLPQLLLRGSLPNQAMGLTYGLTTEYVDFDHDDKIAGQRMDFQPSLSLPLTSASGFVIPKVALRYTHYDLDDNVTAGIDKTPSRTLPVASVDSGLFFERTSGNHTHTLEPRAFYLYIPERNQSDIPIFDSGLNTFNMGQLFAYNRFSGSDRVGDANQLSLSLTSRLIDQKTGEENLRVSLGQIQYFSDRDVVLPDDAPQTSSSSDIIAEIVSYITKEWTVRGEVQWDPEANISDMSAIELRYLGDNGRLLHMSHRYRRDDVIDLEGLEQIDISGRMPFNKNWSVVGRFYRSLKENRTLESLAGIEYQSCCWATRLVARDYAVDASNDRNLAIFFQIELKGLGQFGQKTEDLLENSIPGYGS
jgi:LPS-assembly protein